MTRITDVAQWVGTLDIDQVPELFAELLPHVQDDDLARLIVEGLDDVARGEVLAALEEAEHKGGEE